MNLKSVPADFSQITTDNLLGHISTLASDKFEGRAPGTLGEQLTLQYLVENCQKLGLEPAGDIEGGKPTYLQSMAVTGMTMHGTASFECLQRKAKVDLAPMAEMVVRSQHWSQNIEVSGDVVFVGYGIVAPEYGWDDYKGLNVRGKTVVMLIGDPDENSAAPDYAGEAAFFKGKALTYYGRWTYKYEIASEKGAAAVFIVHDTQKAAYGWDVVQASWGQESFSVADDKRRVRAEGWLSAESAEKIFALGGHDFGRLKHAAQTGDFYPVELGITADIKVNNRLRTFQSSNVLAKITGSDEKLKHETVVYCAHWDHFGKVEKNGQTEILSGALDNGSGVAVTLEIARSIMALKDAERPKRTILFLFTTLEEAGLLGAHHYVNHPVMPLADTIAIINFDIMNPWGRTRNLISVARGHSTMDETIEQLARTQGRTMGYDLEPDKGYFFRSDHLEFLRKGVPALFFLNPGDDFIDQPADYAEKRRIEYLTQCYHKAADKVNPAWDLSGMLEDAQLLCATGLAVANDEKRPQWKEASEFKR